MYKKLKRTWTHSELNYIPKFKELFPELKRVDNEELADRFLELGLDFYTEEKTKVSFLTRLTLPFALITMLVMLIGLPFNFLFTGSWYYGLNSKNTLFNWFKSLRLM